ncbi:putative germin-like protein subfamily 3 member 2-like [Capsicum annuum]|nr:putative germin-like protein subfamily 3 member 2-like [Capsicum annuum]
MQALLRHLQNSKSKKGYMLAKTDLEKAFDRLEWSFIHDTLLYFRFPQNLVTLIMSCVSTTSVSLLVNGSATPFFTPSRGIHQGDPLCPYLFIMCMERLSRRIETAVENCLWTPIKLSVHAPPISHLLFADDILLCAVVDSSSCNTMTEIFKHFEMGTTYTKCKIYLLKWLDVTTPKDTRGLGIQRLMTKNLALLASSAWHVFYFDAPWAQILRSKYLGRKDGNSRIWKAIMTGAALLAPVINFWWPGFPANLTKQAFDEQLLRDRWAYRVIHYVPWLVYWWNTQHWFPGFSVVTGEFKLSQQDIQISSSLNEMQLQEAYVIQQGEFESLHRDLIISLGKVEFDPMDLKNPFPNNEGSVHIWHGVEDGIVSVELQRFIARNLPWIHYHELQDAGHIFPYGDDSVKDALWKSLLLGLSKP